MRYRAIIFDLDGTLRISQPRFMDALLACAHDMGIPVETEPWRQAERWIHRYWARSPELVGDLDIYDRDTVWVRFLWRLLHQAGYPAGEEEAQALADAFAGSYRPDSVLMPGAQEVLEDLASSDVTLGVLSNREQPFDDELEALNIGHHFNFTLAAGEVGIWKPQPEVFYAALERAGHVSPQHAIYIGDNYYADIVGARAAGLDALLVDSRAVFADVDCPVVHHLSDILTYVRNSSDG